MLGWRGHAALLAMAAGALAVHLLVAGYQADFPINHNHQIPLLLALWDPAPFARDPLVPTLFDAPHPYWSLAAALLRPATLDAGLFLFHLAGQFATYAALAYVAAALSRRPLLAALLLLLLLPVRTDPLPGGAIFNWMYPTPTQAARALGFCGVAAWLWGRPVVAGWCAGGAVLLHPFFGLFVIAAALPLLPFHQHRWTRGRAMLAAAPVAVALVPLAAAALERFGAPPPPDWAPWVRAHYALHVGLAGLPPLLTASLALLAGLGAAAPAAGTPRLRVATGGLLAVTAGAVGLGALLLATPLEAFVLNLQPNRIHGASVPLLLAVLSAGAASLRGGVWRAGGALPVALWGSAWCLLTLESFLPGVTFLALGGTLVAAAAGPLGPGARPSARPAAMLGRAAGAATLLLPLLSVALLLGWTLGLELVAAPHHLAAALALALGAAAASRMRGCPGARGLLVGVAAAAGLLLLGWGATAALHHARAGEALLTRAANPALRDAGDWLRLHTPANALVAAPVWPGVRGLRPAAWRSVAFAEVDEAGIYYRPVFLAEWRRREALLGPAASRRFFAGDTADYLAALDAEGVDVLVLPFGFPVATLAGWRTAYANGALRVLFRAAP